MGSDKDIEEKFKKDVSKEISNLKEFLIQQGKEIVRLKQDAKAQKEIVHLKGDGTQQGLSSDLKLILDKQQHALDKQKENTTKLSKLCLGTLTELEKLEKNQQDKVQDTRTEEKMKRLSEENRKLIHLVTALDQQVTVLEGRLEKGVLSRPQSRQDNPVQSLSREEILKIVRDNMDPGGITRDEIGEIIPEYLTNIIQENQRRDGQLESLIGEVQNIIGQNREYGLNVKEVQDKVRRLEENDLNEKFGLQLATLISRIEKIEITGISNNNTKPVSLPDNNNLNVLQLDVNNIKTSVIEMEKRMKDETNSEIRRINRKIEENALNSEDEIKRIDEKMKGLEQTSLTVQGKLEECELFAAKNHTLASQGNTAASRALNSLDELKISLTRAQNSQEELSKRLNKQDKEDENMRKSQQQTNIESGEDLKRDIQKLQNQTQILEESLTAVKNMSHGNQEDQIRKEKKLETDLNMISEKVKNLSLSTREEKYKTEERFEKISLDLKQDSGLNVENTIQDIQTNLRNIETQVHKLEETHKSLKTGLDNVKASNTGLETSSVKSTKRIDELASKLVDCSSETSACKQAIDKLKLKAERLPPPDENKQSELTNKLYNDLVSRIDEVDESLKNDLRKSRGEEEKINNKIKTIDSKIEEGLSSIKQDLKSRKENDATLKTAQDETCGLVKTLLNDVKTLQKDTKSIGGKQDLLSEESKSSKSEINSLRMTIDSLKNMESEISILKKNSSSSDISLLQKDIISIRSDIEKVGKEMKGVSTEIKYIDSNMKKDSANVKLEQTGFSKTVKELEKDMNTLHNMVEVLNSQPGSGMDESDISSMKADIKKAATDIKACDKRLEEVEKKSTKSVEDCKTGFEKKMAESKTGFEKKVADCLDVLSKKTGEIETKQKKVTDELNLKISNVSNELKGLDTKLEASSKSKPALNSKDLETKIQQSKDELNTVLENSIKKTKDEFNTRITLCETKQQNIKDDLSKINTDTGSKIQGVEKKVETLEKQVKKIEDLEKRMKKEEDSLIVTNKQIESIQSDIKQGSKQGENSSDLKKEIEKLNKEIKAGLSGSESKHSNLETQVSQVKLSLKEATAKIDKLEKPKTTKTEVSKEDLDSLSKTFNQTQKKLEDKFSTQEKGMKELSEKVGKLEKTDNKPGMGGETSKLTTLSKAIDAIQDNSKSLETMVKNLKTEFTTQKDLEKVKAEIINKVGGGGKELDPNHPDIGPIMDSLIMTNDRPYVDCTTLTPMTGNGLVKFERFNALNKLPWDDANDQFVIQEPGVYAVFISAILQDAGLSIKIASNMLEREVCSVGSRDGLVGSQAPAYVFRSGMFQIEDDDNVCETVFVEIHADNEESFVDKNVCLTLFKIAESTAGD